jgi:hypothetical protein
MIRSKFIFFCFADRASQYIGIMKQTWCIFHLILLRITGLYMFLAFLAHPQEAPHKRHLVRCVRVMSIGCYTVARKMPCAVRTEHVHNIQVNCSVWTGEQTAITSLRKIDWLVLAAFVKLWKGTVGYVMSVRPHGVTRIPLDGLSWHLIFDYF